MAAKAKEAERETPLMKQYNGIKTKHPDALLLFRVGDFYETFKQDAVIASQVLGIVLTKRKNGKASHIELAGFPHHSLNTYLPKLVRAGYRVAICDQLEDPKMTKTIVKRGVTELVTPGVTFNDNVLEQKENNWLAAVHFTKHKVGVSFLDISTGEFLVAEGSAEYIDKLLQSLKPTEVLFQKGNQKKFNALFGNKFYFFQLDDWVFTPDFTNELLLKQFKTKTLKGFGVEDLKVATIAAGAALHYLSETHHNESRHISTLSRIEEDNYVWLDRFTIRNLELISSNNQDATTLIDIIDKTVSPMGGRLMKRWMLLPLKNTVTIAKRHDAVEGLVNNNELLFELTNNISQVSDLERLVSKVSIGKISPREVNQLKNSLDVLVPIKEQTSKSKIKPLQLIGEQINTCDSLRAKIEAELQDDAPVLLNKGNIIKKGINQELDELRKIAFSGKDYLLQMQQRESERTGITSLKIAFNNVFGYYIEVRNTHKDKVPEEWIRKQTLVNAERYITEELKEYESKILGAEEKILTLETSIFQNLVLELADFTVPIQHNAHLVAQIDCLSSFATLAISDKYCKPIVNDSFKLDIKNGRHPVIENCLEVGESYIPNDVYLDEVDQQIIMITGPNMSGKSAILRQTALIVLMAQMGSFVPAESVTMGFVDKIFTRVGASDNISSGESTFMVEMNETASILNNISDRSLILLDEIGRGTSTYDGISIAWSITEYIHEYPQKKAKTLFATHYHELNEMHKQFPRIKNYNVSVKEIDKKILFMRKLVKGGSNHSFGIHVAKMAGIPGFVIRKAEEILTKLEKRGGDSNQETKKALNSKDEELQLSFFNLDDPILEDIRDDIANIDINTLTPVEALMKLNEIKKKLG
ncbi:MAG: DNA mismatch repair protein MutS [Flavobacteriales bacterium]|jgi:DNA mismatch repair protein MutS|tara:strand:+ start:507 stop:3122 length:2616 start_codon:yes stop_codon:yes gene_type:complete